MSGLAFVADVHVGNPKQHGGPLACGVNRRGEYILGALQGAVHQANGAGATLVVLGDLFDTVRPEAQLIARVQEIFRTADRTPICLLGNHEMVSSSSGDHSLAPLGPVATIVEKPTTLHVQDARGLSKIDLICIPFQPGPAVEWLPAALTAGVQGESPKPGSPVSPLKVLALHLGLQDDTTAPFLKGAHDSIHVGALEKLCVAHGITHVYAGNWHDHRVWTLDKVRMEQVGALHPTGWNNPGVDYGHVALLSYRGEDSKVIAGPRFVVVRSPKDLKQLDNGVFFVRSEAPEKFEAEITERLAALQGMGKVLSWEHDRAADGEETAAARLALSDARAAAKAGGDALAEYVEAMPLPQGVERPDVLAKARALLGGAI